jgi:hypothetical protein
MAKVFDAIDEHWADWIARQPMFFVATAPLAADGHVNVSPKGPAGALQVLGPHEVAYVDYGGSGAETMAHLRENGRIVVMLCAFEGPPRILRLHGHGTVLYPGDEGFDAIADGAAGIGPPQSRRAVVRVAVRRIADSCGYGVPLMDFAGEREHYEKSVAKHVRTIGEDGLAQRRREVNAVSLDGLPALPPEWAPRGSSPRT